jgi:hypothetical protein
LTNSPWSAIVVAYGFTADIAGNVGNLPALPCPEDNKSIRAGKGNLFVGFRCKLSARGGSAVHLTLLFLGGKVQSEILRSAQNDSMAGESQEKEFFFARAMRECY